MKAQQQQPSHHCEPTLKDTDQVLVELSKFPMNQLWRYVVDGQLQKTEGGWQQYNAREPGSVSAAIKAMAYTLTYVSQKIDLDLIRQLHIICGAGVKMENAHPLGVFNNDGVYVQILTTVSTPQGISEFLQHHPKHNIQGVLMIHDEISTAPLTYHGHKATLTKAITLPLNHYTHADCPGCRQKLFELGKIVSKEYRIIYHPPKSYSPPLHEALKDILRKGYCKDGYEEKSLEEHTQDVIDTYNKEQQELDDPQKRSVSALLATQEFVRLHPFPDMVNRVFVNCLHFLMDIKNGYVPPLYFEPNIFEFSHLYMLQQPTGVGQRKAFELIDHPENEVYGVRVNNNTPIAAELKEATELFMSNLARELFDAAQKYVKPHPQLACVLLNRACLLFSQVKSRSAINYASYLKLLGSCQKRLGQTNELKATIAKLRLLANECRAPGARFDLSGFSTVINKYIEILSRKSTQVAVRQIKPQ